MNHKIFILIFSLLWLLSACANPGTQVVYVYPTATPGEATPFPSGKPVLDAKATLTADEYYAQQTRESAHATQNAYIAQATGTAQAQIYASATAQAQIQATGTALAQAQATGTAVAQIQATNIAAQQTAQAWEITRSAAELQAQLDTVLIEGERQRIQLANEREALWNQALQHIMVGVVVVILGLLLMAGLVGLRGWWIKQNPIVVIKDSGSPFLVREGYSYALPPSPQKVLPAQPKRALLPPPASPVIPAAPTALRTPRWAGFMRFIKEGDKNLIPIGLSATGPIFINRKEDPHGLLVGTTGAGKSKSGVVPFAAGMAARGIHVLAVNGRGSDFNSLSGRPNITIATPPGRREHLPIYLETVVSALVAEADRRDKLLQAHNVDHWSKMPEQYCTGPEIALIIDEFLGIVDMAQDIINDRTNTPEERAHHQAIIFNLWRNLKVIVKECRKHGLYLFVTATDPTAESLGKDGMQLRRQMFRIVFRMKEAASSRAILGNTKGSDYPNGSVSLGTGQFLYTVGADVHLAAGFFPSEQEIDELFAHVRPVPTQLPEQIVQVINRPAQMPIPQKPVEPVAKPVPAVASDAEAKQAVRAEVNGRSLDDMARNGDVFSLNKIALELSENNDTNKASGEEYQYAVEALIWRIKYLGCSWAMEVARKAVGKYGQELQQYLPAESMSAY